MKRPIRIAAVAAAIIAVIAVEWVLDRGPVSAPAIANRASPIMAYPPDYSTALADADRALETARQRVARDSGWLAQEMHARAYFDRGRLTASVEDYLAAQGALEKSASSAPAGSGPHLLQAAFALSVHRLDQAETHLNELERYAVSPPSEERAEAEAMRGDIAFYRGRYDQAVHYYDRADRLDPGASDFRRAYFHLMMGFPERGIDDLLRPESRGEYRTAQSVAWTELQRGVFALEGNKIHVARDHFLRANRRFPGHWLIEEHIAETLALSGDTAAAERRYRDIVDRTNAPEFMDELAELARQRNDMASARHWTSRAASIWQERLSLFPEAYYAPAAEHCLAAGNLRCAIRLAEANYRSRPYGEAAALLGEVLVKAGRETQAAVIARNLSHSAWRSARARRLMEHFRLAT